MTSVDDILGVFSTSHDVPRLIDAHELERNISRHIRYANEPEIAEQILAAVLPIIETQPTRDPGGTP
jgi:hypothetical protein